MTETILILDLTGFLGSETKRITFCRVLRYNCYKYTQLSEELKQKKIPKEL